MSNLTPKQLQPSPSQARAAANLKTWLAKTDAILSRKPAYDNIPTSTKIQKGSEMLSGALRLNSSIAPSFKQDAPEAWADYPLYAAPSRRMKAAKI